jgi:hypothetical protein
MMSFEEFPRIIATITILQLELQRKTNDGGARANTITVRPYSLFRTIAVPFIAGNIVQSSAPCS